MTTAEQLLKLETLTKGWREKITRIHNLYSTDSREHIVVAAIETCTEELEDLMKEIKSSVDAIK